MRGGDILRNLKKVYLEITNVCNLNCSFCPGTKRELGFLSPEGFQFLAEKLRPHTEYLYLHLMGEPLLHHQIEKVLVRAGQQGFKVMITTNGTLLRERGHVLLAASAVERVSISLHSFEGSGGANLSEYLDGCLSFTQKIAETGKRCALRLWNLDGPDIQGNNRLNDIILAQLEKVFPKPWKHGRRGITMAHRIFLEWGEKFDWPDLSASDSNSPSFCYGLRDHVGVLWNGTVVPCCLDHEGDLPLGNLYQQSLEEILNGPLARNIYEGFSKREARENLCRRCGFARRF